MIVDAFTNEQAMEIDRRVASWRQCANKTDPIRRDQAEKALASLYRYMGCEPPRTFLYYQSPTAALSHHHSWAASTGRVATTYWPYQLPICDPTSYFRRWLKCPWVPAEIVDLGVTRWPNAQRAFVYASPLDDLKGGYVSRRLLDETWMKITSEIGRGYCDVVNLETFERFDGLFDAFQDAVCREDPTSQVSACDYFLLGALDWLVAEAACAEICRDVLEVRINPTHVEAVAAVARSCSIVYAFERICVLCERPETISADRGSGALEIAFRDGFRVEAHGLGVTSRPLEK